MAKIMLVEDDKSLREIYSIRLVAEGYDIVSAGDGEEALGLAVQEKPDLIISDVMMPKISGFDMLDILRSTPETKDIKVIIMTALSNDDQRQRSEALGAAKHLVKSQCGIEDVINAVHEVLGDAPNNNAQANIATLNATATPEGKEAASKVTPLTQSVKLTLPSQPAANMNNIPTNASTVVEPQGSSIPAPDANKAMPSSQDIANEAAQMATAPATPVAPNLEAAPISAAPVAPAPQPVVPQPAPQPVQQPTQQPAAPAQPMPAAPVAQPQPATPAQPAPQTPNPMTSQGENPVNFNQASVAQPVANPAMPNMQAQFAAGANIPVQQAPLTPQQLLQYMGYGSGSMPAPKVGLPKPGNAMQMTPAQLQQLAAARQQQTAVQPVDRIAPGSKISKGNSKSTGERVLEPIHDDTQDRIRAEMQRRFADLLNEDPTQGQSAEPAAPVAPAPAEPTVQAAPITPVPAQTAPVASQSATSQSAPAPQMQAMPAAQPQAASTPQAQPAPAPAASQPTPQQLNIDPNATIADLASIAPPVEDEPTVAAIRPAYLDDLENQLSQDLGSVNADDANSMTARMAAELADDEITEAAREIASRQPKQAKQSVEVELPKSVIEAEARRSPNISNPNIS